MTAPHATQTRDVRITAGGGTAYEVTTVIDERGDLPTANLFVLSIVNSADPKSDVLARVATPMDVRRTTGGFSVRVEAASLVYVAGDPFARVASLADLDTLAQDRTDAVRSGRTEYLVSAVTLLYTSLETADAAYRQIIARLSALAESWATFTGTFETNPTQGYTLPVVGQSVEDERAALYAAAVSRRRTAATAADAAAAAHAACLTDCAADRTIHAFLVEDVTALERAKVRVEALTETGTTNVKQFALRQGAFAADADSYEAFLQRRVLSLATYAARVRACQERCALLRSESDSARAELDRSLADERRALADVRAVCPTFTPTE